MGAPTKVLLTAEEFDNYPFEEDKRYELDEGEMIEVTRPAFDHNKVLDDTLYDLKTYFRLNRNGIALGSENLYAISAATRLAPDVAIFLGDRLAELRGKKVIPIIPDIVVEVLSPSETPRMIHRKLKHYFAAGVKEVWVIDPDSKTAEIWTGPTLPERELTVQDEITSPLLPGFAPKLEALFS